jgi:hypothetical protein
MYASGSEVEKFTDDRIQKGHDDTKIQPEVMYFYKTGIGHHSRAELSIG